MHLTHRSSAKGAEATSSLGRVARNIRFVVVKKPSIDTKEKRTSFFKVLN